MSGAQKGYRMAPSTRTYMPAVTLHSGATCIMSPSITTRTRCPKKTTNLPNQTAVAPLGWQLLTDPNGASPHAALAEILKVSSASLSLAKVKSVLQM